MQQLSIEYFYPLTEQISLDLDYTPCTKYEEDKRKNSMFIGNRIDQWGVTSNYILASNGATATWKTISDPRLIIYPESTPVTIRTKEKPSILARWVYKILGVMWEKV